MNNFNEINNEYFFAIKMNDLEEKIDKIQKDFDNEFAKIFDKDNPSNKDLSYTNLIIPYVKKIEKILPENSIEWPIIVSNKYAVNIYYEFLYYHCTHNNFRKMYPLKLFVILMVYQPFIYYVCCMSIEYSKIEIFKRKIKDTLESEFTGGKQYIDEYLYFHKVLDLAPVPPENKSAISYFHAFTGFKFDKSLIAISKEELEKIKKQVGAESIFYINIIYNSECYQSDVYIYKDLKEKIGTKIVSPEIAKNFQPILKEKIPDDYHKDKLYEIDKLTEKNLVVINYDNKHYTVPLDDHSKPLVLNSFEIEKLKGGALPIMISQENYRFVAENSYYQKLSKIISKLDYKEHKITKPIFSKIYFDHIYEKLVKSNIKTKLNLVNLCNSITVPEDLIDPEDLKMFKFYASLYSWRGEFNHEDFLIHIQSYFQEN